MRELSVQSRWCRRRICVILSQHSPGGDTCSHYFCNLIMLPFCRTSVRQACIRYQDRSTWSRCQSDIKLVDSIASFNKKASLIALSHDSSACMKAPSKEIYRKQTICDSLSTVNGNRGRIKLTYPFAR